MGNAVTENPVFKNIKKFIEDEEKNALMEKCYSAIRTEGDRVFDRSLPYLSSNDFDAYFPLVSAVIFTANKFECDTLNYLVINQNGGTVHKRREKIHIFGNSDIHSPVAYILKVSSSYILHLLANETGSYTPGGSSDLVRYISGNPALRPSCIISFGICYGRNPDEQIIGDVLIPRKLYPWSIGQKVVEEELQIKNDNFNLWLEEKFDKNDIYSSIAMYCNDGDGRIIEKSIKINNEEIKFKINISYGNVSTGEAVVSSKILKDKIAAANRNEKEIGGEMEGYGLAKECVYYAKIPCVIIKSICDWGELKNIEKAFEENGVNFPNNLKDKLQAYASFCAGLTLLDLFLEEGDKLLTSSIINGLKEKYICNEYHYSSEEKIKDGIKELFDCEIDCDFIFDNLLQLNKLIKVEKDYKKMIVYCIERRKNA